MIKVAIKFEYQEDFNEIFDRIIQQSKEKLHFEYFFKESILSKINLHRGRSSNLKLKFSNKFLPSTLPKMGEKMDELMRMQ